MFTPAKKRILPLPIDGTVYEIPSPSAKLGLFLTNLKVLVEKQVAGGQLTEDELALLTLDDDQEQDFYKQCLSPTVYDRMLADGVDFDTFRIASQTVMEWVTKNRDAAEQYWNAVNAIDDPQAEVVDPKASRSRTPATAEPGRPDSPGSSNSNQKRKPATRGRTSSPTSTGRSSKLTSTPNTESTSTTTS